MALEESHTVECMAGKYLEMLAEWEITHDRVHLVLRDNAASMAKAMRDASLRSLGCFARMLQLVVQWGDFSVSGYGYSCCVSKKCWALQAFFNCL